MKPEKGIDDLVKDLFNEDDLGSVIRSHIRIESILLNIIDITAPNPDYISKLELGFDKTVTLGLLLGLNESYAKPLRVLGKLRNDFAHKPDMKLSKNAVNNLYSSLNTEAKEFLQQAFKNIKKENKTVKPYAKFSDMPPVDQLRLLVVSVWAQVQSALVILNEEKENA